ncbi:hypothetical protein SASPL_118499 [Salvia splendens]|uniref:BHLH domain-containing protein n=1 Tax=Salvia splendens TaxID=180675 RepID=A0A8X8XZH9_SALSN|nr:hypothetical protein SASPL_118499 [Salvia splendens]
MEFSTFRNIADDFGMDDPLFFQQWQVDPIDDFYAPPEASPGSEGRAWKQLKGSNWSSCKQERMSNSPPPTNTPKEETWFFPIDHQTSNHVLKPCQGIKRITPNTKLSQPNDHILAERKRREKLSHRLMDKASVLGDAIEYMKQLQEKVKALEEKKTTVVLSGDPLPEIEARICDKDVLISIHCEKRKGILEKTVAS